MTDSVRTEVRDRVLIVTIDRQHVRNAVDAAAAHDIAAALDRLDDEPDLVVGVLTGAGGTFSAGMDLKAFVNGSFPEVAGRGFAGLTERPPAKPLIAAVEGVALAGGFEMVLACDLIVAARNAQFGLPEVKRGLAAAAGGLLRLPNRIPYHEAMRLVLTGERLSAVDAHRYGLLAELTEPGAALDAALGLAATIAANAPLAVRVSKQVVAEMGRATTAEDYRRQSEAIGVLTQSLDALEGARAFVEKRPPVWTGR